MMYTASALTMIILEVLFTLNRFLLFSLFAFTEDTQMEPILGGLPTDYNIGHCPAKKEARNTVNKWDIF